MRLPHLPVLAVLVLVSQTWSQSSTPLPLWPEGAPGALGTNDHDIPTLTAYLAPASSSPSPAIVICPGGGYGGLAAHEGKDYAVWMNSLGVSGFVLKYRLGTHGYRHPRMLEDVSRAIRLVRARASDWNVDPRRVGVMGSSAGGHLASTLVTHFDAGSPGSSDPVERHSSRPDLGILCYPVISMGVHTHAGSRQNLLGANPTPELLWQLSNELQVTPSTPPCFLWHTYEDQAVKVENVLDFAQAMRRANVPFDLHIYQKGRHGIGLAGGHPWTKDCAFWLKEQGFAP